MNVTIEEISPSRRKLLIEVPAEEVTAEYNDALKEWVKHVSLPGFRPGKAPANLVKARHNKDIVKALKERLLPRSYKEAVDSQSLRVEQIVDLDKEIEVKPGEAMRYSITVDLVPEISLPDYASFRLQPTEVEIVEAEVQERIDALREQRASFEDVTRPVCRGDMVQIDFTATVDGTPLLEVAPEAIGLDQATDFWLAADENAFIPELGEGLAGLGIGESSTIPVTFDDKFAEEALRGKTVSFAVTVKAVRGRVLPELDEEFIKPFQVETVEAFLEKVKESLAEDKKREQETALYSQLEDFLMQNTEVELPESAVDIEANQQLHRLIQQFSRQGAKDDQILEQKEKIVEVSRDRAQTQVKMRYILKQIAEKEAISVSSSEVSREIAMTAYGYGMKPADLEKELATNNTRENFETDLLMRKTMKHLFDLATKEA